jgi:hypothetical protein
MQVAVKANTVAAHKKTTHFTQRGEEEGRAGGSDRALFSASMLPRFPMPISVGASLSASLPSFPILQKRISLLSAFPMFVPSLSW